MISTSNTLFLVPIHSLFCDIPFHRSSISQWATPLSIRTYRHTHTLFANISSWRVQKINDLIDCCLTFEGKIKFFSLHAWLLLLACCVRILFLFIFWTNNFPESRLVIRGNKRGEVCCSFFLHFVAGSLVNNNGRLNCHDDDNCDRL